MTLMEKIAAQVYPLGARLECMGCGRKRFATQADCANYLANGWPLHCKGTYTAFAVTEAKAKEKQNSTIGHTVAEVEAPEST